MDLSRLLNPRSIAVVGATPRTDTYAHETLLNLETFGYAGEVWGVHPRHEEVRGRPCFPSLADLPAPPDAVVVATAAATVPSIIEQAGATGCGGAVVYAAGFADDASGAGAVLQAELQAAAARHALPVVGPNCNGIVRLHDRVALWGDALRNQPAGHVALVAQSGNVAVNALGTLRGLRLHTVISCGNQAVLDATHFLTALAQEAEVRSVALFLEDDGDGGRLCEALARCTDAGIRVAVLKVGASEVGATAAAAHTGSIAGDQRVFRALVEEAGAAWALDVHELLEMAKALATPVRVAGPGVAVVTCSGGDCGLAADESERLGVSLPPLAPATTEALAALLPAGVAPANPLDYTAQIWGEVQTLRDIVSACGKDPAIDQVMVIYDQPPGIGGWAAQTWTAVREGIAKGAAVSPVPTLVTSTLPELLDDEAAAAFIADGVPAISGLTAGLRCALALQAAPATSARLREIGAACAAGGAHAAGAAVDRPGAAGTGGAVHQPGAAGPGGAWLAEHEAKDLLRAAGVTVAPGRAVTGEDDAVAAAGEVGWPVAIKLSSALLQHKTEAGALALGIADEARLRDEYRRIAAIDGGPQSAVLVEAMASGEAELLIAARRDAVVPALVVAVGGVWTEVLADAVVIPLPATPDRVVRAIHSLRAAPLLTGGRGRTPLAVAAAATLAALAGDVLLAENLELLELNPVIVGHEGAVAVDALARRCADPNQAASPSLEEAHA